jgi:hypothetical protein
MKRLLTATLILGLAPLPYAVAEEGAHAHQGHQDHQLHHGPASAQLQQPGQAAFGALSEVVALLQADPSTDWSKVDITSLRDHLVDMDEVVMRAVARLDASDSEIHVTYTGEGRTLEAIRRMIPAHAKMMQGYRDWKSSSENTKDGVVWILSTPSADEQARIRGLGPFGLLTLGFHHGPHHLAMARGLPIGNHEH